MNNFHSPPNSNKKTNGRLAALGQFSLRFFPLVLAYFLIELTAFVLLQPSDVTGLAFGLLWALLLSCICLVLPRKAGRIFFGVTYFVFLLWTLAQVGYYQVFNKLMWISTISYAGEGATFLADVISAFPLLWWIAALVLIALGVALIIHFPKTASPLLLRLPYLAACAVLIAGLFLLPEIVFLKDLYIWGTRSEYAQSSSYRATYNTMYDARSVYDICGVYQLTLRDFWNHELYPLTPAYQAALKEQTGTLDDYFSRRGAHTENEMTGIFAGKNVVLVLMESMDDWMITPEDTPTLYRMMEEGINFENFYTPGYGSARTFNSEFCMNTGIYLPTTGGYVFDYVTNSFNQSLASQLKANGYAAEVFHYNDPDFYSRGVFESALGYNQYNCYADYEDDKQKLYDDCLLFDIPQLYELFFHQDVPTFNTIITRSAHLSYKYNEVLSHYALNKYPQYRGMYGSEEEDCARVKAHLVDDMFARLLAELSRNGQLENTVIVGITDHYTYGYKNEEELLSLSGVSDLLMLEKTPCFIWSADGPDMEINKTLQTADLVPTLLNLLGIKSPYSYLGQDAFDPGYTGYALFPDGSWISNGIACTPEKAGGNRIIANESGQTVSDAEIERMNTVCREFIRMSNLLLSSNYYK